MLKIDSNKAYFDILASIQSKKILTGTLSSVEIYREGEVNETIYCGVVFYNEFKIIIPAPEMNISRYDKKIIRSMIGAEVDYIVKKIDDKEKVGIGSRVEAMELRKNIELRKHKAGDIVQVRVTSMGKNNCRVDCYGLECKVPIDEIDYGYIDDINEHVKIGDKVMGVIKELDIEKNLVKISLKEAKDDPYENLIYSLNKGGEYLGIVTGIQEYGIFLSIRKGIHCLCPFPNWTNFSPYIGEKFVVKIKSINYEKKRVNANLMRHIN